MKALVNFVKGIAIGIAAVIPGLSGSVFAVVVGLYDNMLFAINNLRKEFKKSILFLLPIVIGALIGVLISTNLVLWLCKRYALASYFLFIGLVLGSIPLVYGKAAKVTFKPIYLLLTLAGLALILTMSYLSTNYSSGDTSSYVAIESISSAGDFITVMFAGLLSCSLMSIPGVSGSVMLMVIGQYGTVYNAVGKVADMLKYLVQGNSTAAAEAASSVFVVLPFAIGAILGFILIAKLLAFILKKAEAIAYYAVGGLILGAAVTLFTTGILPDPSFTPSAGAGRFVLNLFIGLAMLVGGYILTRLFSKTSPKDN